MNLLNTMYPPCDWIVRQNKCLEAKLISSNNPECSLLVSLNMFLITFTKSDQNIDSFSLHSRVSQLGVPSDLVRHDKRFNTRQTLKLICVTDCPYTFKACEWHGTMQRCHCVAPQMVTGYVGPDGHTPVIKLSATETQGLFN